MPGIVKSIDDSSLLLALNVLKTQALYYCRKVAPNDFCFSDHTNVSLTGLY